MKPPLIAIGPARTADEAAITALLRAADLPHEDVSSHLGRFLVAQDEAGQVVGAVGAEVHAPDALLRSLVVAPGHRGTGLGAELVRQLEAAAGAWGVARWWLLTTSAEAFFLSRGFTRVARPSAPAAISATQQFSGGSCASAVCLSRPRLSPVAKPAILILCTGNSCRSHLAEGVLRAAAGDVFEVHSAGSKPAGYVHPLAIRAMAEIGIDLGAHRSKHMNDFLAQPIETVITVCGNADQACPVYPGQVNRHHWPFDDPAHAVGTDEEKMAVFRRVRDEIRRVFGAYADGRRDAATARRAKAAEAAQ